MAAQPDNAPAPSGDGIERLLAGYKPYPGVFDELMDKEGHVREHWRAFLRMLATLGPDEVNRRFAAADILEPKDHKAYLHRSGRTARAGSTGVVVSLLLWNQIVEAGVLMKRLALKKPVIEVFSNDPNLKGLGSWNTDSVKSIL